MSAIPPLTRSHVEAAIARIDREGVPARRGSTKFHLVVDGRRYPPKYVLSLASYEATRRELRPQEFSGGDETNSLLQSLGFTIVGPKLPTPKPAVTKQPVVQPEARQAQAPRAKAVPAPAKTQPRSAKNGATSIVRVVVQGQPAHSPRAAGEMLLEAFEKWPAPGRVKFTITPGGFVRGDFPSRWHGGIAWESSANDLDVLVRVAKPLVEACVTKKVLAVARPLTRVLTIGVDLISDVEHAELVAVIDCDSREIVRWTGKSYPTGSQEAALVQVADIDSHLLEIADEKVLVLGCHDLNMFSARARANQSPDGIRRQRCDEMARATARFKPTVVLQHPHSTDSANIWRMPWACLARDYPSVRTYASGIAYFNWHGPARRPLRDVLAGTRSEAGVADVVVKSR
jgi:hypothetical protein